MVGEGKAYLKKTSFIIIIILFEDNAYYDWRTKSVFEKDIYYHYYYYQKKKKKKIMFIVVWENEKSI